MAFTNWRKLKKIDAHIHILPDAVHKANPNSEDAWLCTDLHQYRSMMDELRIEKAIIMPLNDPWLMSMEFTVDAVHQNFVVKNDLTKAVSIEQDIYSKELMGSDSVNSSDIEEETTSEVDKLKTLIREKQKSITSPAEKQAIKAKLEEKGLPTSYKNVTDVEILKAVIECFD